MPERWRVTPRDGRDTGAYGYVWWATGSVVTAAEVGAGTLQRLDGDPRFVVALEPEPDAAPRDPDPKPAPRPRATRRRG